MTSTIEWNGYNFLLLSKEEAEKRGSGGVYLFAALVKGQWEPLYIGKADSFANRLPCHDRWKEAQRNGATHVILKDIPDESDREEFEAKLIRAFQPPLNTQWK